MNNVSSTRQAVTRKLPHVGHISRVVGIAGRKHIFLGKAAPLEVYSRLNMPLTTKSVQSGAVESKHIRSEGLKSEKEPRL